MLGLFYSAVHTLSQIPVSGRAATQDRRVVPAWGDSSCSYFLRNLVVWKPIGGGTNPCPPYFMTLVNTFLMASVTEYTSL